MATREGWRSPKWGHLGVYFLCTGPGPGGPAPGERVRVVIYDKNDNVVRRFEQLRGECVDPGYVDFWNSPRCRPAQYLRPLVDIAPDGKVTTLLGDFKPHMGRELFETIFVSWVKTHGVPEEAAHADEERTA